ncbi:hypothetical protein GGI07_000895 [Coemansia sp. Benny D115]|nr:hypothetical protein GGI07_000895 [Coemansia sp. Benny D115]
MKETSEKANRTQQDAGAPLLSRTTTINTSSSGSDNLDDFFSEDPAVLQASMRIRRILYRKRERQIARWSPMRRYLHILFYEPSSMRARVYIGISTAVVLLFLIVFMIDTLPQYRIMAHWRRVARSVNLATALFFAIEWTLRFYSFQKPMMYLIQPLTILDMLGIIPGFVYFTNDNANFLGRAKWLRALQVLRVLRVLRLTEYSVELYVTIRTLKKSLLQILVVMTIIVILLLTACFLMFFAENDSLDIERVQWLRKNHGVSEPSPFQNVFFCLYWGFVTITTVGYGDYTPVSPWGQVIASVTMFMGVFTIVFPTSIISNNFASEWDAFRKAQKIHEHRVLQYEYEKKRRDLVRVWSYANKSYDGADNSNKPNTYSSPPQPSTPSNFSGEQERASTADKGTPDEIDGPECNSPPRAHDLEMAASAPELAEGTTHMPRSSKMAPFEYDRMINIAKKVEENLGIPGVSIEEVNTDSKVNQSLVVNAMYSKLYNDAFSTLCERMLMRLLEHTHLESIDELACFLQNGPQKEAASGNWPHEKKLTMLEYKLLDFTYGNVSTKVDTSFNLHSDHTQFKDYNNDDSHNQPINTSHRSSLNIVSQGAQAAKTAKDCVKSRLSHAYSHLPLSREPSHQSVHNYMSATINRDTSSKIPSKLRFRLQSARKRHQKDIGSPVPMRRSVSTGAVNPPGSSRLSGTSSAPSTHLGSPDSTEVAINMPSSVE